MHSSNPKQIEMLNYLAAAIIAASGLHTLFSLLALPGVVGLSSSGLAETLLKTLKIVWTFAGAAGGAFVAIQALFIINGRSYRRARIAAIGALVLPLLGVNGVITAFPLLPVGVVALALLLSPKWKAAFSDSWQPEEMLAAQPE